MAKTRFGGSFAPPLDSLEPYKSLAATAPEQVKDYMTKLIVMLETFRQTPDSTLPGSPHPSGRGNIVPLDDAEVKRIWDVVPWSEELDAMAVVFDRIGPEQKPLRDAAFHLLWFGRELCADREPITSDKL